MKNIIVTQILHKHYKHNKLCFLSINLTQLKKKMAKEKKESKSKKEKKEKKEKTHKEKKEKHSSKNKEDNVMEVDVISPVSTGPTPTITPAETKSDKGLIVHYDLRALIPFAQPLASEKLTREIMIVIRKGNYIYI